MFIILKHDITAFIVEMEIQCDKNAGKTGRWTKT